MTRTLLAGLGLVLAGIAMLTAAPGSARAQAQAARAPTTEAGVHEAAFTLYRDKIIVPVVIEGKTFTGVYDSGAATSVLSSAAATAIAATQTGSAVPQGFGGETRGKVVRGLNVRVGDTAHTYTFLPVADLSPFTSRFGRPIDFLIGVDAFFGQVVEVDWADSKLRWTPRAQFTPPAGAQRIGFDRKHGLYRTVIHINGREATANVDLGASEGITISDRLADRLRVRAASTGMVTGIGGDVVIGLGSLDQIDYSGLTFRDMPFMLEPSRMLPGGVDVNIGLALLARYRVFLDYKEEEAWLAPIAERAALPFDRNTTGLRLARTAPDRLKVMHVGDASPAKAAGLSGGEEILTLDDAPIAGMAADADVFAWTRAPGGDVRLKLADGREITLTRARFY